MPRTGTEPAGLRPGRSPRWVLAVIVVTAAIAIALSVFSVRIYGGLETLRATSRDNVQWSLAQLEVEYLVLLVAVDSAQETDDPAGLKELRQRFDIFYSRTSLVAESDVFDVLARDDDSRRSIQLLRRMLDEAIPLIDGGDAALRAALPEFEQALLALRPEIRKVEVEGLRLFAAANDARRETFSRSLLQTAIIALCLIALLVVVLTVLARQNRISGRREEALRRSSLRYAQTIEASLNAIIVSNEAGKVVEFNPAAERIFGYTRSAALGRNVGELIVPPKYRDAHHAGVDRYRRTGIAHVIGREHVELEAMRSSGEEFPVELALARTTGPEGDLYVAYIRDITQRVKTERELTDARDKALAAARAKSQFLAVMSHEMRTPLNGVLAVLDLLESTDLAPKQKEYVQTAIISGELLQRHIDDVLDMARIEAGGLQLQPKPFSLSELLEEIQRINQPAAEARGNTIAVNARLPGQLVLADRNRLAQVLMNLVGNAVKFTENGRIHIEGRLANGTPDAVEIVIADTGIGIAKADQERIFDDFVTLDPSYRRTASGYGLGLSICRRIMRAMDGDISVESTVGQGSRFTLRMPIEFIGPAAETPDEPADAAAPPRGTAALNVLVVEDNETNRFAAREMLNREGCEVTEACDGLIGLSLAEADRYDLIFMDVSMPRLDGLEATRAIRRGTGASRDVPIIGLTAHALPEEQEKLLAAGMQDCLFKPLRFNSLRTMLAKYGSHTAAAPPPPPEPDMDTEADTDADAPVDRAVLDELASLLAPGDLSGTIDAFVTELEGLPAALRAAGGDGDDLEQTRALAHKTAGSAAVLGATAIQDVLSTLEDACADEEAEFVAPLTAELERLTPATVAALRSAIRENATL